MCVYKFTSSISVSFSIFFFGVVGRRMESVCVPFIRLDVCCCIWFGSKNDENYITEKFEIEKKRERETNNEHQRQNNS